MAGRTHLKHVRVYASGVDLSGFAREVGPLATEFAAATSLRPVVKPPEPPPSALPSVEVITSTRSMTPWCSGVPRPVLPMKPVAWLSSTISSAS